MTHSDQQTTCKFDDFALADDKVESLNTTPDVSDSEITQRVNSTQRDDSAVLSEESLSANPILPTIEQLNQIMGGIYMSSQLQNTYHSQLHVVISGDMIVSPSKYY